MKIVIFTAKNHIYANRVVKELLFSKVFEVVEIIESDVIYRESNNLHSLIKYIKISGLNYVFYQMLKVYFFKFYSMIYTLFPHRHKNINHPFFSYHALAKDFKIPIYREKNINRREVFNLLAKKEPDIFVSVLFNQIIKDMILSIPKSGTINLHPALLTSYRGVSPVFWVLANGEAKTGVSIHKIDNLKIDEGEILAQKEILISSLDTEHSLYWRCVEEGSILLRKVIEKISKGQSINFVPNNNIVSNYFSLPTKEAVKKFKKNGKKFFTFRDFKWKKHG